MYHIAITVWLSGSGGTLIILTPLLTKRACSERQSRSPLAGVRPPFGVILHIECFSPSFALEKSSQKSGFHLCLSELARQVQL